MYLAKEVAAILRAVLTHETKKLYNDGTVHLLCSNHWMQPIYQGLLHSSSRYNATRERKATQQWLGPCCSTPSAAQKSGSNQLLAPTARYLAALPTLRHSVIAGVFRNKGAATWGITRAEKLQLSVFLP